MKKFALLITLVLLLTGSALAQSARSGSADPGFWGGTPLNVTKMAGPEVSAGTIDYVDSICWGRTFLMTSDSGSFTFMPNYSVESANDPVENFSRITGGAWTMEYKSAKLNGMLFGELTNGEIEWYMVGKVRYGLVTANMTVKGGTGSFDTVGGPHTYGTFTGVIDYSSGSPSINGSLDLLF